MKAPLAALLAGAAGAVATNVLHEGVRRTQSAAPRVDILGMQALAKGLTKLDVDPPTGKRLYVTTLAGDLVSNTLYFALVGFAPRDRAIVSGTTLGVAAGLGAVYLPSRLGLTSTPTNRTPLTRVLTILLYGLGGFTAGSVRRRL